MIALLDELHKLIWKYEMEAGTQPDEITITKSVMRDFMREATELRGEFEHTFDTQDGIIGKYQGIPIKVAYGNDDDKRIIVTGKRNYKEDDQDVGITDEQLVDLLNGGGFNAVS